MTDEEPKKLEAEREKPPIDLTKGYRVVRDENGEIKLQVLD